MPIEIITPRTDVLSKRTQTQARVPGMYNGYLGQQRPQDQQGYQPGYQIPQQTGYVQPPLQQQAQQTQFIPTQPTGYGFQSPLAQQPGQFSVIPPVPAIPAQYVSQASLPGIQTTGYTPQPFQHLQQPQQQVPQNTPPTVSTPTGHSRQTSTAMGTSTRIPNGLAC